jgi:hypothetical protein
VGILDTILGRSKPVRANLDALFALPGAAVTMQVAAGLVPGGRAGVCFKPPTGQPFEAARQEIDQLLAMPEPGEGSAGTGTSTTARVHDVADRFGYRWIVVEGGAIDDLVTRVHMVHSSLEDAGWGPQLLCSVFSFVHGGPDEPGAIEAELDVAVPGSEAQPTTPEPGTRPIYLVYLAKRGTFYPFAPVGHEQRDNAAELQLRAVVGKDLPVEDDLSRWFPIWDLPLA